MTLPRAALEERVMDLLRDLDLDPARVMSVTFEAGRPMVVTTVDVVTDGRKRTPRESVLRVS